MTPRVLTAVSAWISVMIPLQGCGPFFPDTVLNKPQAALAVPPVSYLHQLYRLAGKPQLPPASSRSGAEASLVTQIPLEVAELRAFWKEEGLADEVIAQRILHYEGVRQKLLAPLPVPEGWATFPTQAQPPDLPVRPLGNDFPQDVADYVEAARLHAGGMTGEACAIWKSILDKPPAARRLRGAWAAWMLARTTRDHEELLSWLARVQTEVRDGASDVLGLAVAAKCVLAGMALRENRMTEAISGIHAFYDAFVGGRESAAIDLRNLSRNIASRGDAEILRTAAADPLVRRLINLEFYVSLDGTASAMEAPSPFPAGQPETPLMRWLAVLETLAPEDHDDSSRVAWALYSSGRYDDAARWLSTCPEEDPLAWWLRAKFDLRDGKLDDANKKLAAAVRATQGSDWHPANSNTDAGSRWFEDAAGIRGAHQSRLLADSGIVSLALKDYLAALESLRKGGYPEDAAYLAECVISTDGLMRHVRKVAPEWTPLPEELARISTPIDPANSLEHGSGFYHNHFGADNQLRYQLARRLARERRFQESREFMPPDLLPVFDHYVKLDKARRSGRYSGEALAAITWRQARMHRHLGAELFSTDGSPDGGALDWSFRGTEFHKIRILRTGWKCDWSQEPPYSLGTAPADTAIPEVTTDEITRVRQFSVSPMRRFHYRHVAADLAWQASRALPPNHPDLARLYNTAGKWIATGDPQAADRFYQAMVRRCAKTPEGKAADDQRWFLADLAPLQDLRSLPEALRPAPNTAARP